MDGQDVMTRKVERVVAPAYPDLSFEIECWRKGILAVGGADEAGRGAWAGPVAAAAVILPSDQSILTKLNGVRDSKMMSPRQREKWAEVILQAAVAWGVSLVDSTEIDRMGILPATRLAFMQAIRQLAPSPQQMLLDYIELPELKIPQIGLVKGDARCLSIAAASVLAKTSRDQFMRELDVQYPEYGFAFHKGYGTQLHQNALEKWGPCPVHRMSYKPVQRLGVKVN